VGRRLLETLATSAGYYLAGDLMRQGDYGKAALALAMAVEARPDSPYYWYNLACCRARVGARDDALDALEEAVSRGFSDGELLASDTDLESLRGEDRYRALVGALRAGR
jgi:tetratricopeptide (TPR) repeat protein